MTAVREAKPSLRGTLATKQSSKRSPDECSDIREYKYFVLLLRTGVRRFRACCIWPFASSYVASLAAVALLSSVNHGCHNDPLWRPINLIHHDVRQSRHSPFECIRFTTGVAHKREVDQQFRAAEEPVNHGLCRGRAFLSYPVENVFQIGERLVVPNEFNAVIYEPSLAIRSRASA
jgi:hypothetical protein